MDSDLLRTSLPLRSDAESPPGESACCASWPPHGDHTEVCSPPQQDDIHLLNVRRFGGNDFRIFDRAATTATKNVHAACTGRMMSRPKLRRFVTQIRSPFTWQNVKNRTERWIRILRKSFHGSLRRRRNAVTTPAACRDTVFRDPDSTRLFPSLRPPRSCRVHRHLQIAATDVWKSRTPPS